MPHESFWKQFPPIPGFDCVAMKHEIQARIYEDIRGMSPKQIVEYFESHARARADANSTAGFAVRETPSSYGRD